MKINYKALMTALVTIAGVIVVHTELLVHFQESTRNGITLVALVIVALSEKVVDKHED